MFDLIFEYYRLNNYDTRPGAGVTLKPNKVIGRTSGQERPLYPKHYDDNEDYDDEDIDIDDASLNAIFKKLYRPTYVTDPKRSDLPSSGMRQGGGLYEDADHTNTITKGIAPFRQRKFDGPPIGSGSASQAFRTTGNYKRTGTQYGSSRAPIDYESENYSSFDDEYVDPMERSFLKYQKKIKKLKKSVDSIESIKKNKKLK